MRILILSNVHANWHALEAIMKSAPEHEALLCLGDVVGYGANPNECCDVLRERGALCLSGNHDAAIGGHDLLERMNALAQFSNNWTRTVLSTENRAWLASLSPHLAFEEWGFEAVHAALDSPLEGYINGIYSARESWSQMKFDLCFFGHTHVAASLAELNVPGRKLEVEERKWRDGGRFSIRGDGWKTLVNPGSVGQPRDGNPLARFALFDVEAREVEVFAVRYDVSSAQNAVIAAGFPLKISERLALGR